MSWFSRNSDEDDDDDDSIYDAEPEDWEGYEDEFEE